MTLWIDADGCPVIKEAIQIAKQFQIEIIICKNDAVKLSFSDIKVISLEATKDAVDFYIVTHAKTGDIVVTQDFGLAAMLLPKLIHVIRQDGFIYSDDNMPLLLDLRHISAKERRQGKYNSKKKKRTSCENEAFIKSLTNLVQNL